MSTNMDSFVEHYQGSDYAAFAQDHRRGGTFGLQFLEVQQGTIETEDPAIPEMPFVTILNAHDPFQYDFGDGWRTHKRVQGVVDLQPPDQACRFRLPELHLRIAFAPVAPLRALLDERGLRLAALEAFSGQFRASVFAFTAIQDMWRLSLYDDPASNLMIDGLWLGLIARLLSEADQGIPIQTSAAIGDARLRRVVDYVEAHLSEPLCIGDLAAIACMSASQFSRSFRSAVGEPPASYVTRRRCAKADLLLRQTRLPVGSVASICGFRTTSYFSTVFRQHMGRRPSEGRD